MFMIKRFILSQQRVVREMLVKISLCINVNKAIIKFKAFFFLVNTFRVEVNFNLKWHLQSKSSQTMIPFISWRLHTKTLSVNIKLATSKS